MGSRMELLGLHPHWDHFYGLFALCRALAMPDLRPTKKFDAGQNNLLKILKSQSISSGPLKQSHAQLTPRIRVIPLPKLHPNVLLVTIRQKSRTCQFNNLKFYP